MKGISWGFLCSLDVVCYLSLIKKLYNTLTIGEYGLYAIVKRFSIKIIEKILGRVLHMSTTGMIDTDLEDKEAIIRMIIGDNAKYTN